MNDYLDTKFVLHGSRAGVTIAVNLPMTIRSRTAWRAALLFVSLSFAPRIRGDSRVRESPPDRGRWPATDSWRDGRHHGRAYRPGRSERSK